MKTNSEPTLFNLDELEKKPRRKPRKLMHVIDAGPGESGWHMVVMRCVHCGLKTGWFQMQSITESKAGIPCPKCMGKPFKVDDEGDYIVEHGESKDSV